MHQLAADTLSQDTECSRLDSYWRAANYLAAAQIYLKSNQLLEEPLRAEHIKSRLLGHWGTAPGINFIYAHLNRIIRNTHSSMMLVTGPGHGAPANLANLFLEGTLGEFNHHLKRDRHGVEKLISMFSVPGGNPSHLHPGTPGVIHEGGELGYALATAFGAAFDNPDLIVACIVGDGEAETGPTATAWHSTKFLNPATDGAVLPILHLNGYKISCPTVMGSMSDDELTDLFRGYGYRPYIVYASGSTPEARMSSHASMMNDLDGSLREIRQIQAHAQDAVPDQRPCWPMIILRSPKGWTDPAFIDGEPMEGSFRSHQVPAAQCKTNLQHLTALEEWLRSYEPQRLFAGGSPSTEVTDSCPTGNLRMGMNPHAYGGTQRVALRLPDVADYSVTVNCPGTECRGDMTELGGYLRDVISMNSGDPNSSGNFRIFCPDEMTSNRLNSVFDVTNRQYEWPTSSGDDFMAKSGRVIEMLSEHNCQAWLQGYVLTGRHGLFPCYEAFAPIVDSMMNQYAKFLKVSEEIPWRTAVSGFTYILTSEGWRQDHNGYSHQGPGFINNLLTRKAKQARIYLPPDTNCLISTVEHCLTSTNKINLIIASKQKMPQWLNMEDAIVHCTLGASTWRWASTFDGTNPDVVLAGCGVYTTAEVMAAAKILSEELPELRLRVVNVTDLLILEPDSFHPHGLTHTAFDELFTADKPVVFNFHGYPSAVKQLLFDRPENNRFQVNGYIEEGTTTTPFDLLVRNKASRYHIVVQAVCASAARNPDVANRAEEIVKRYTNKLAEHASYISTNGEDMPEITNWCWTW